MSNWHSKSLKFSKSLKESTKNSNWVEHWSFLAFSYGFSQFTRRLVILRAMSLLDNEWNTEILKKKIDQNISEVNYHRMLVLAVASGDIKFLTHE